MAKITLMDDVDLALWYYDELHIVHHEIRKFPSSERFRAMLTAGAECMEKHGATKWLSDDRKNPVVRDDDAHWGDTVWAPRVIKAGFKYWAIVLPHRMIGNLPWKAIKKQ